MDWSVVGRSVVAVEGWSVDCIMGITIGIGKTGTSVEGD